MVVLWLAPNWTRRLILELVRRQHSCPSPRLAALGAGVTATGRWEELFILLNNDLHVTTAFSLLSYQSAVFHQR